jgi:predicted ribosome quality control (RQC) complex YloA/Tae2 family protein
MDSGGSLKAIRQLIGQTPLIVDPDRDAGSFQTALAAVPTEKLQSFYRTLTDEDRRRFHYVANVCLGFESWSRLYKELVVQETQALFNDRLEEAYAQRTEEFRRREEELQTERGGLEEELMRLDRDSIALRRENLQLRKDLNNLQQNYQTLQRQHQQLLALVERYKLLLQEFKNFIPRTNAG